VYVHICLERRTFKGFIDADAESNGCRGIGEAPSVKISNQLWRDDREFFDEAEHVGVSGQNKKVVIGRRKEGNIIRDGERVEPQANLLDSTLGVVGKFEPLAEVSNACQLSKRTQSSN
jgi:hypothetical protein